MAPLGERVLDWLIKKYQPWRPYVTEAYVAHLECELNIARKHISLLHAEKYAHNSGPDGTAIVHPTLEVGTAMNAIDIICDHCGQPVKADECGEWAHVDGEYLMCDFKKYEDFPEEERAAKLDDSNYAEVNGADYAE